MNLSKLYALLNAVPIIAGGAQAVMDAMMQKNMTFPEAISDRIAAPQDDLSFDDWISGLNTFPHFDVPTRDFQELPKDPNPSDLSTEVGDFLDEYDEWHYDPKSGFRNPPYKYYEYYPSPKLRRAYAKNNNQLFQQYPKLLEAFKEWRSK